MVVAYHILVVAVGVEALAVRLGGKDAGGATDESCDIGTGCNGDACCGTVDVLKVKVMVVMVRKVPTLVILRVVMVVTGLLCCRSRQSLWKC